RVVSEAQGGGPRGVHPEELLRRGREPRYRGHALPRARAEPPPAAQAAEGAAKGRAHRLPRVRHGRRGGGQGADGAGQGQGVSPHAVDGALTRRLVAPFLTAVTLAACGGGAGT